MTEPHRVPHVVSHDPLREPAWLRYSLIVIAIAVMGLLVALPLVMVLSAAFGSGFQVWWQALVSPDARSALHLTLLTAAIVIPVNAVFGVFAAYALTRFSFRGKRVLLALIDLPFAVSPVVAGLCLVLLFGNGGWFHGWLQAHHLKILFARPAIVLATLFVTFPFVVRELVPLMQQQGADEELAARSLGASAWTMFFRITLPKIKWGLLYGVLLCAARAMGEFGAVSVVSGHIRGMTNTLPLHIEILYNEFDATAAFAVASLLAGLSLLTLVLKLWLEARHGDALAQSHRRH
jgi:sulfate transport system permease protein